MQFTAKLRPGSYVDKSWKIQRRLGGILHGVAFRKIGHGYETVEGSLSADQVEELKLHPDIELVMISAQIVELAKAPLLITPKTVPASGAASPPAAASPPPSGAA